MYTNFKLLAVLILLPLMTIAQYDITIKTGSIWVDGDVDKLCGIGSVNQLGATIDYQVKNNLYITAGLGYGNAKGLEQYESWRHVSNGGGLQEGIYDDYADAIYAPYHSTNIISSNIGLVYKAYFNDDNIFLKTSITFGLSSARTYMNLYDAENKIYDLPVAPFRPDAPVYPTSLFDDTFESRMIEAGTFFHLGPSVGLGFNISNNGFIGIGYAIQITNTDYLDGIAFRTAFDDTNNSDLIYRASLEYTHRFGTFQW